MNDGPLKTINLPEVSIYADAPNVANVQDYVGSDFGGNSVPVPRDDTNIVKSPALAGAVLTILSIAAQVGSNIWTTYKQHQYQLEYMDKSQQQALERWAKENEYNDPSAVKNRLLAAGLNPNLIYGQSGVGLAGSTGSTSAPEAFVTNPMQGVPAMLSSLHQQELLESEIEVNRSIANKNNADAGATPEYLKIEWNKLNQAERDLVSRIQRNNSLNEKDAYEMASLFANAQESIASIGLIEAQSFNQYAQGALHLVQSSTWQEQAKAMIARDLSQAGLNNALSRESAERITDMVVRRVVDTAEAINRIAESDKRIELMQGQLDAMAKDIFESQRWIELYNKYPDDVDQLLITERTFRMFGSVFGVNLGSGAYYHKGFNQSQQVPTTPTHRPTIGYGRH